jgi:iron(III) transport system substrate-binding protein
MKVDARYDNEAGKTVGLVQKIRSEAAHPAADVFWSNEMVYTIRLAKEGMLKADVEGPAADPPSPWTGTITGPQEMWRGFALRARVIAYNTKKVTKEQAPKKLEDLLDPRWKGRIVMARPEFGTTGGDIASWFAHYGPDKAKEILRGLKANDVRFVDGNSMSVREVADGRADIGLTDTDDAYAQKQGGKPVDFNYLDQGGEGVLTIPNTVALIKGGPHGAEAEALYEFLLSKKAERMLAESESHNTPVRPEVAKDFPQFAIPHALKIDYEKVADQIAPALDACKEIFKD